MNKLNLNNKELTELTESNLKAFCELNDIKFHKLNLLLSKNNKLKNIDFIQPNTPFINLKYLYLHHNNITDINNIKYLYELKQLDIDSNKITDISIIQNLKK